ncbi:hypothetical protein WR25_00750 isoform A [Diploscapter pachys]|uniref:C2H2-type domain-containing protein n=1 Tax=Diploscapter pachys TaxID=2018661 RepID=A0A2A2LF19_9BILA|nr:hypothetical protein WR25_00750 isoform A [Diploscapter pachys]
MPYRPENELKRPDLKGEFLCGHCGKTFCHAASLNRHRLNFHGDDQICQICEQKIPYNDTVRRHMSIFHGINRVFTCGCCNWTFPDKKELHAHNNSMQRTGQPGEAKAIAISNRPPGSLSQAELRGEERHFSSGTPSPKVRQSVAAKKKTTPAKEVANQQAEAGNSEGRLAQAQGQSQANGVAAMMNFLAQIQKANVNLITPSAMTSNPTEWLTNFLMNNPGLIPLLQQQQQQAAAMGQSSASTSAMQMQKGGGSGTASLRDEAIGEEEEDLQVDDNEHITMQSEVKYQQKPTTSNLDSLLSNFNQLNQEKVDSFQTESVLQKKNPFGELLVKTEIETLCSGPESGIGSGEDVTETDSSPAPSDCSKESTPIDESNEHMETIPKKRKSVDAIASLLFKKKCLMG